MRNDVRHLRSRYGWTQADLAIKLGVSRQTVIAIERGRYDPSLPLAIRMARVLGVSVERLFRLDE